MFLCDQWRDYEVLDTGDGEKLERWGGIVLRRPDPQVIWPKADPALWDAAQATYMRSDTWRPGTGSSVKSCRTAGLSA